MDDDPTAREVSTRERLDATRSRADVTKANSPAPAGAAADDCGSSMRARAWVIAAQYGDPAAYGIPDPPTLSVSRTDAGGIELSAVDGTGPFIRAGKPVSIRR